MQMERILFAVDGLRRHWRLFLLPLLVALPIALLAWKTAAKTYEAKSTILMISANRAPEWAGGAAGFPRQTAIEQIAVLEAWLKSDQVLGDLLPQLIDDPVPTDANDLSTVINRLRRSLTLQLIGAAVLEVQLQGDRAEGLGKKVELIVTRLLEGVLNPDSGILSAPQMIMVHRREAAIEAEQALVRAIEAANVGAPQEVIARLRALHELRPSSGGAAGRQPAAVRQSVAEGGRPADSGSVNSAASAIEQARRAISSNDAVVDTLEKLYERSVALNAAFQQFQERAGAESSSYVRVFDAPERLTVIGRPRDPLVGTSPGRKYAIFIMAAGGAAGLALVLLAVQLDRRLRVAEDFEKVSGLPVIARLPRL